MHTLRTPGVHIYQGVHHIFGVPSSKVPPSLVIRINTVHCVDIVAV